MVAFLANLFMICYALYGILLGVYSRPHPTVNENYVAVNGPLIDININKIRINHYCVRSLKDCLEVKAKVSPHKDLNFFNIHDRNEIFDDEIYRRFGHKIERFHNSIAGLESPEIKHL